MKKNYQTYLLLNILLAVYSFSTVFSKKASAEEFLSGKFILYYGLVILLLGIYAIFWQQIIKEIPLTTAYANRAVTLAWGLLWGILIFHEEATIGKITGICIVMAGILLYVTADGKKSEK
ncbi:MAG: transporter [Bulleidia sp.]|nr:transporter [Bulleidia sp.]